MHARLALPSNVQPAITAPAAMEGRKAASGVDYSRWDALDVEEEEEEKGGEPAPPPAARAFAPVDEGVHAFLEASIASALPDARAEDRAALLRFLRVQDPRGEPSNVLMCNQMVELLMQSPVLATKASLDRACALARRLLFGPNAGAAPDGAAVVILSAVNTLAACVEFGAINLFAQISAPRGEEAERMRLRYERKDFGRDYLLGFMGWDEGGGVGADGRASGPVDEPESGGWWCTVQ